MSRRTGVAIVFLALLAAGVGALRMLVGGAGLSLPETGDIAELRLLRLCAGAVVGGTLGVAGVMLQNVLRNPLASPDLLGLGSGAALCVAVATLAMHRLGLDAPPMLVHPPAALVGSFGALAIVYALAQRRGVVEPVSLILVGVIVSIMGAACATLVTTLMPPDPAQSVIRWLFGSLSDETRWATVWVMGGALVVAVLIGMRLGRAMDAAAFSDDEARSIGVNLPVLRLAMFGLAGVLTAASVVIAGPIGFVGLVCPHVARLVVGPAHRPLLIASMLCGIALLVGSDTLVKSIELETGRVPIGVVTALVGGPVFVVLLRRTLRG